MLSASIDLQTRIEQIVKQIIKRDTCLEKILEGEVHRPAVGTHEGIEVYKVKLTVDESKEEWFLKIPNNDKGKEHVIDKGKEHVIDKGKEHVIRGQWLYQDEDVNKLLKLNLIPCAVYGEVVYDEVNSMPYLATKKAGSQLLKRAENMNHDEFANLFCCLFVPPEYCGEIGKQYNGSSLSDTLEYRSGKELKRFLNEMLSKAKDYINRLPSDTKKKELEEKSKELEKELKEGIKIKDDIQVKLCWAPTDLLPQNITVNVKTVKENNVEKNEYKLYLIDQSKLTKECPLFGPVLYIREFYRALLKTNREIFNPFPAKAIEHLVGEYKESKFEGGKFDEAFKDIGEYKESKFEGGKFDEAFKDIIEEYKQQGVYEIIQDVLDHYFTCRILYKINRVQSLLNKEEDLKQDSKQPQQTSLTQFQPRI